MSWEDIVKFERNPYFDGESYMEQVENIAKDIEKVIEKLREINVSLENIQYIEEAIKMLEEINTRV
jgi:hypothetical protein